MVNGEARMKKLEKSIYYTAKPGSDGVWRVFIIEKEQRVLSTKQGKKKDIKEYARLAQEHQGNVNKVLLDHYNENIN
jgi:DNA-binding transcriptional regulator PaaX